MFSRLIIIVSCISLLGVSIVPAYLLPCCCKSGWAKQDSQVSGRSCPGKTCEVTTGSKSCCAKVPAEKCCSQNMIKKDCPNCRCLDQMQIVTLSGHNDNENTFRISALTAVECASLPLVEANILSDFSSVGDIGGVPLSLQTCILRC
jgi:hypothetical protein